MGGPEKPKQKPKKNTEETMDQMMMHSELAPDLKEEMQKYPKEVDPKKYQKIVNKAKRVILEQERTVGHNDSATVPGEDGFDYLYVRDNNKDRLFRKKAEKSLSAVAEETIAEQFDGAYVELKKPKGRDKQALNYAKQQIGGDPMYIVEDGNTRYVYTKQGKFYKSS